MAGEGQQQGKGPRLARIAWIVAIALLLAYEAWALLSGTPRSTLSEAVWDISIRFPLLPFGAGVLMGHFFWQRAPDDRGEE